MYVYSFCDVLEHICDWIWRNPTFFIFHQKWDFAIFSIHNVWITSFRSMSVYNFYHQWATENKNAAINIANIESGKLACADTQNRTLLRIFTDPVTFVWFPHRCWSDAHFSNGDCHSSGLTGYTGIHSRYVWYGIATLNVYVYVCIICITCVCHIR